MIVLVYGLPGTGKTFFARHLARETGAIHLNTDLVREKLDVKGQYDDKTKQQVYNELFKQVMRELNAGKDVIVDGTFHKQIRREQVKKIADETNNRFYLIEIKADEKTVRKRLRKNRKHSDADFNVYQELEQLFEKEEASHLELWSEKDNAEEMMNKAKEYING
jgi:predicted kinase